MTKLLIHSLFGLITIASLSSCFNDDNPLGVPTDPCSIVHETYPNVGEDSCSFVLDLMENYPVPTVLPPATDTGGQLLAARILTDTGVITFVAGGIPALPWSFATPCSWWQTRGGNGNPIALQASYCRRPPLDTREMQFIMFINYDGSVSLGPNNTQAIFQYKEGNTRYKRFVILDPNMLTTQIEVNTTNQIVSGTFSGVFHNQEDSTETIQILDGRFDARY